MSVASRYLVVIVTFCIPRMRQMQMKKETKFPPDMNDITVCSQSCDKRSYEKGRRLLHAYAAGYIKADGSVEYGKLCIDPTCDAQGVVTEMTHVLGHKPRILAHMPMNKEFKMWENHLDMEARTVLQKQGAFVCVCVCWWVC